MNRINITEISMDPYADWSRRLVGWFDADAAEKFVETRYAFDGANLASVHTRDQNCGEELYRTAGGRWVLRHWSAWQGHVDRYEFVDEERAREWLMINEEDDETMARLFGAPPESERGPGRPEIGPSVQVRMTRDTIAALDAIAMKREVPRAELIREIIADYLRQHS